MTTVKYTLDPNNPPKLTKAEKARYDALKDEDIDYSDAPELDAEFWSRAEVRAPNKPKEVVTMRLDVPTLEYFKGDNPKGYTAKMAAVLKAYVQAHQPK